MSSALEFSRIGCSSVALLASIDGKLRWSTAAVRNRVDARSEPNASVAGEPIP